MSHLHRRPTSVFSICVATTLCTVPALDLAGDDLPTDSLARLRGHFTEAENQLRHGRPTAADRVLMAAASLLGDDPRHTARYLLLRGHVHRHYANRLPYQLKKAAELFEDALEHTKGDALLEARIQVSRAMLSLDEARRTQDSAARYRELERATRLAREALAAARTTGSSAELARVEARWCEVAFERGWRTAARESALRAITHADADVVWRGERVLGRCHEAEGDLADAREHYRRALNILEELRREIHDAGTQDSHTTASLRGEPNGDAGFVAERMAAYDDGIHAAARASDWSAALLWVERARARFGPETPTADDIADLPGRLADGETLLVQYDSGRGLLSWVISRSGIAGHMIALEAGGLREAIDELRRERGRAIETSEKLSSRLLSPWVRERISPRVFLAPFGFLRHVPYDGLFDGRDYWVESRTVSYLASALDVGRRPPVGDRPVLAILDPATDYDLDGKDDHPRLPAAEDGTAALVADRPGSTRVTGAVAREAGVAAAAVGKSIVHIACHGEFERFQPWESALLLAPGDGADGRLRAHELSRLPLAGVELVCLSGCETGLTEVHSADDLAGFPRAILMSGARRLLGSLWKVEDQKAGAFMTRFYRHLGNGRDPEVALREAKLESLALASDSSPEHWAGWVLLENDAYADDSRSPRPKNAPGEGNAPNRDASEGDDGRGKP